MNLRARMVFAADRFIVKPSIQLWKSLKRLAALVFRKRTLGLLGVGLSAWFVISNLQAVASYLIGVEQTIGTSSLVVISAFLFSLSIFLFAFAAALYVLFHFLTATLQIVRSGLLAQAPEQQGNAITQMEEELGTADRDGTSSFTPFDEKEHSVIKQLETMRAEYGFTEDEMDTFKERAKSAPA